MKDITVGNFVADKKKLCQKKNVLIINTVHFVYMDIANWVAKVAQVPDTGMGPSIPPHMRKPVL